jgi:hypothetical protein
LLKLLDEKSLTSEKPVSTSIADLRDEFAAGEGSTPDSSHDSDARVGSREWRAPIRVEYPGTVYRVSALSNERRKVFRDDGDRGGAMKKTVVESAKADGAGCDDRGDGTHEEGGQAVH